LDQRFTRSEVERMTGATRRQLNYWARLGLVNPRVRWGERFFGFSDLVAVETIRRITERRVPAGRLRRAMDALDRQLGKTRAPLASLRIAINGSQIIVHEPGPEGRLVEPISGQFLLNFDTAPLDRKVRSLGGHSAEQWFELGMAWDANPETLPQAADAYRSAIELSPEWVEAYINLGTALYQLGRMEESRDVFRRATALDPRNALARFNLGCMHDRLGDLVAAIEEFAAAVAYSPHMADAHLNLALAYEKGQEFEESLRHLSLYLRYEPQGPWADFARMRLRESRGEQSGKVTPFRKLIPN
jgi:tetratricopeptide (TPR) repeat protein